MDSGHAGQLLIYTLEITLVPSVTIYTCNFAVEEGHSFTGGELFCRAVIINKHFYNNSASMLFLTISIDSTI